MSLLLNEDFSTYQLRLAYLRSMHDGVGERLINLNTAVLNNPAFRAAGWTPDNAVIKRCYSPPIPTTGAGEYFQVPRKNTVVNLEDGEGSGTGGGMVTGQRESEDTIGAVNERKRRQNRKEQLEEEDSSDLSDDSDEEEKSAAYGIKFSKMPVRGRSKSSPAHTITNNTWQEDQDLLDVEENGGPELMITSPSKPPETAGPGLRRGSLGQVEAVKQRARRDTTTSSEMSSENELVPEGFNRKLPGRPGAKKSVLLAERIQEEEQRELDADAEGMDTADSDLDDDDVGEASDLSDEFEVEPSASHSPALLGMAVQRASDDDESPLKQLPDMPPAITSQHSPKKQAAKDMPLPKLPKLPPGRPISKIAPPSLISMALKGSNGSSPGEKPFQRFADLSGKGEAAPLWIKIYAPFSEKPTSPIQVQMRRNKDGNPTTVSELIGLALWRYNEEDYSPPLASDEEANINRWDLRIVEDEEIDFDFPALVRTRPVTDFTSNNNRPPQRRARDKPWDEFGLVKASDEQFKENEEMTPQLGLKSGIGTNAPGTPQPEPVQQPQQRPTLGSRQQSLEKANNTQAQKPAPPLAGFKEPPRNPITASVFTSAALRKDTGNLADAPQATNPQFTPRTGAAKTVTIYFVDPQTFASTTINIPTTADTYIAEIFDQSCKKLGNLDKGLYLLKVRGTQTVAPSDRTVEALGDKLALDLVRRRFMGAGAGDGMFGLGLSGSPGSSSPNAPLELNVNTTPPGAVGGKAKKGKGTFGLTSVPAIPSSRIDHLNTPNLGLGLDLLGGGGKKYNVLRKQPLSFAPSHPRTLIITPEYLQILPAAPDSLAAPTGKVTNVAMSSVVGVKVSRKHPKMVRVLVYREKETKRYDFECASKMEAEEVVNDVRAALDGGDY